MQKAILFWRNRKSFGSASLAFSPEQILKWNGSGIALSNDKLAAQQPRAQLFFRPNLALKCDKKPRPFFFNKKTSENL